MKRILFVALLACALQASALAAQLEAIEVDSDGSGACTERPGWCRTGFVCAPTACVVELRAQLAEAHIDLRQARLHSGRLHVDLTCGPGAAVIVTDSYQNSFPFTPMGCVVGLAVRLWPRR